MAVKFFGQFLIDQGEIDASHLREALDLMEDTNPTLGELAIECGYMTQRQATQVSAAQRNQDLPFGDLAVKMGFLGSDQLVDVVQRQATQRLPVGQALVRLGYLDADRLGMLLDAYKADQAPYDVAEPDLPDALANHRATKYVLELLPRFLMRVARMQAKLGEIQAFASVPPFAEVCVSVHVKGVRGLEVALVSDNAFAEALAMAASGLQPSDLDPEMVADGVGEFLNVLGGNAVSAVTKEGQRVELGPPDYDAQLADGWIVELAVGTGRAALVLSTF
ncbi:MAG: chemotaxis protein CheX [bacterium]|nr:chemotaxis protein CheX [bacterium]